MTTSVWTGSNTNGTFVSGNTCSRLDESSSGAQTGTVGSSGSATSAWNHSGTSPCSTPRFFYCINAQSSSAAPTELATLTTGTITSVSVVLNFVPSGGTNTTAAYGISYQAGVTAPATCTSGTQISPYTVGVDPSSYTIAGLSPGTAYAFRVCAVNSDLSSYSPGLTLTTATNPPVAAPTFSVATGTYNNAQSVTLSTATGGASIYYTTDGSTPSCSSTLYSSPINVTGTETLQAIGCLTNYNTSTVASATYTLLVATPTISLVAGTYNNTQSATLSTTTTSASLYYTTDGSTPTCSSALYSSPVSVAGTETLKVIGCRTNFTLSSVASAAYLFVVTTPIISLTAGTYNNVQSATLSTTTSGASIYYTTDGSTPTCSSALYSSPISVAGTETLKVIGCHASYTSSGVASAAYTMVVAALTINPGTGAYGATQSVSISTATIGASLYYTTDGTTPICSGTLYSSPISVVSTETIKAIGCLTNFTSTSVASATITIQVAATPTISLVAGTYNNSQSATLSTTTGGASIYYTTNGTTPNCSSTLYSGAITVNASETLQAIACETNYENSGVASAVYTFVALTPTFGVAAGTYNATQTVSLSTASTGASIYYTTNGTTPNCTSTLYATAVSIAFSQTLKAIACEAGYSNSSVASAAYAFLKAYTSTGSTTFPVPTGCTSITVTAWGAGGGGFSGTNFGGGGGFAQATLAVTAGNTLTVLTGAGGGAAASFAGSGGGGASSVKNGATWLIAAGGGGGSSPSGPGGDGGGASGVSKSGGGGTNAAGGSAGVNGTVGSSGQGGNGANNSGSSNGAGATGGTGGGGNGGSGTSNVNGGGGGGGGGYFGGGGAAKTGGGGGGSGMVTGSSTTLTAGSAGNTTNTGNANYVAGVGKGGTSTAASGGPGEVVIAW